MRIYLVDNGSLKPDSYLNLRRIARALSIISKKEILPVSLLHSSKIPAEELEGEAAMVWERQLKQDISEGHRDFAILPFFFGPTGALLDYIPRRLVEIQKRFGHINVSRFPFIAGNSGEVREDLMALLIDSIDKTREAAALNKPPVILVDHGSPLPEVTAVRDRIAARLNALLNDQYASVVPASMERRDGPEYAFTDPLLANLLNLPKYNHENLILCQLFLSPGRHAGPHGDIAKICTTAISKHPHLTIHPTDLVGQHPQIIDLLANRLKEPTRSLEDRKSRNLDD